MANNEHIQSDVGSWNTDTFDPCLTPALRSVAAMQLIRRSKSPYVAILPRPSLIAVFAGRRRITSETRCTTVSGQVDLIVGPSQPSDHKFEGEKT
jgi:hypothetical protein